MLMKKSLLVTLAALALSCTALTPVTGFAKAQAISAMRQAHIDKLAAAKTLTPQVPDPTKGVDFAQNHSDIKADPAVRFGRLANGMTYVILKNATPPGTVSMRLRINGGSLNEDETQRGLAHFLEHMAFNGSKNVAEGDMVKILERHGLAFGADTNAHTNFEQTVYELDLPTVADDDLNTGLFLLRETAGNLSLDDGAIDRERGVILGEERSSDSPSRHSYVKWAAEAFGGQKYASRMPIGLVDIIKTAKRDRFVDFYNSFYRPEQATLIIVGDIDPTAIEDKIKTKFSDWASPAGPKLRVTDYGAYTPKGVRADTYSEAGLRDSITVTWFQPLDESYQSERKETVDFVNSLRLDILNERLERLSKLPDTPFANAKVFHDDVTHTGTITQLSVVPKPGKDKAALTAAYAAVRQFEAFGADQPELDRALTNTDSDFKASLQGANTRNSRDLSEGLVDSVNDNTVFTSPKQDYDYYTALRPTLTLKRVNDGIKPLFSGDGPLLWHSATDMGDLDKQALLDTYNAVEATKLAATEAHANKPWPYTQFGTPATVVKREVIKDLDITQLTYSNGVKATIKTTNFKADEIDISVRFAGGLETLSPADKPPVFAASASSLEDGGLGKLTASELKDSLTGKIYSLRLSLGDDATSLAGGTTKTDFATQMQVLMAFTTDAAYRTEAFDHLKAYIPDYYKSLDSTPGGVFQLKASGLLRDNDSRYVMPSQAEFLATTNDQVKALIDHQLKTAPVEITIVGDISEADAEAQISQTFAALAPRADKIVIPADSLTVKFPTQNLNQVFEHHGRADQDLSVIAWPGVDFPSDPKRARALNVLISVLNLRLIDVVREQKAIAYSPYAGNYNSQAYPDFGYLVAQAEVRPENDQAFYDAITGIVTDLKAKPVSSDEFLRAQKPLLDSMDNELKTNGYWSGVLPGSVSDPKKLDYIRSRREQYTAVTPADVQALAATYLDMSKALRIQVKPAATAAAPATPTAPAAAK